MAEYVSISELPQMQEVVSGTHDPGNLDMYPLIWGVEMPTHVDTERMQVNVSRLQKMHKIGAFITSAIASYQGEVTESVPHIAGVDASGQAVASKTSVTRKAEKSKGSIGDITKTGNSMVDACFGTAVALHRVNKAEIASNVADEIQSRKSSDSTQLWARELDDALRQSMRTAGREQLLAKGKNKFLIGMSGFVVFLGGKGVVESLGSPENLALGSLTYMIHQAIPEIEFKNQGLPRKEPLLKRRWSVFPYELQADRYVALDALTRLPGLVRAQK